MDPVEVGADSAGRVAPSEGVAVDSEADNQVCAPNKRRFRPKFVQVCV